MLKLIACLFAFCLPATAMADAMILYCFVDKSIGFEPSENYRQTLYESQRFTMRVDFNKKELSSKTLNFKGDYCNSLNLSRTLVCSDKWGETIALNQNSLKFNRSNAFLSKSDSIFISHGRCEKF